MQIEKDKMRKRVKRHFREKKISRINEYIKDIQPHYYSGKVHSGISFHIYLTGNFKDWECQVLSRMWNTKHLCTTGGSVRLYCHFGNSLAVSKVEDVFILCVAKQLHSYVCIYPRETFLYMNQEICTKVLPETLFAITNKQTKQNKKTKLEATQISTTTQFHLTMKIK